MRVMKSFSLPFLLHTSSDFSVFLDDSFQEDKTCLHLWEMGCTLRFELDDRALRGVTMVVCQCIAGGGDYFSEHCQSFENGCNLVYTTRILRFIVL